MSWQARPNPRGFFPRSVRRIKLGLTLYRGQKGGGAQSAEGRRDQKTASPFRDHADQVFTAIGFVSILFRFFAPPHERNGGGNDAGQSRLRPEYGVHVRSTAE